jgi:hypothetical protein
MEVVSRLVSSIYTDQNPFKNHQSFNVTSTTIKRANIGLTERFL